MSQWTELPRGGHFIAGEHPDLLAADIRNAFRRFGCSGPLHAAAYEAALGRRALRRRCVGAPMPGAPASSPSEMASPSSSVAS